MDYRLFQGPVPDPRKNSGDLSRERLLLICVGQTHSWSLFRESYDAQEQGLIRTFCDRQPSTSPPPLPEPIDGRAPLRRHGLADGVPIAEHPYLVDRRLAMDGDNHDQMALVELILDERVALDHLAWFACVIHYEYLRPIRHVLWLSAINCQTPVSRGYLSAV